MRRAALATVTLLLASCGPRLAFRDAPSLPEPVSNNAVASGRDPDNRAYAYSFMGINDPDDHATITTRAYRMPIDGGAWERIADVPALDGRGRIGANALSIGGDVYILGGYSVREDGSEVTDPRVFRYDPTTDSYELVTRVPVEVDDCVALPWLDRWIVLVSGWHGPADVPPPHDNVRNVQIYDVREDTWTQATPIPGPSSGLFGHAGAIAGDRFVVFDGVRVEPTDDGKRRFVISNSAYQGTLHALDLSTIEWTELPPHEGRPTYRAAAGGLADGSGRALVLGGTDNPYNIDGVGYDGVASRPLAQTMLVDPETGAFELLVWARGVAPTMDHRGLVTVGPREWLLIGGMTEPGRATAEVRRIRLRR